RLDGRRFVLREPRGDRAALYPEERQTDSNHAGRPRHGADPGRDDPREIRRDLSAQPLAERGRDLRRPGVAMSAHEFFSRATALALVLGFASPLRAQEGIPPHFVDSDECMSRDCTCADTPMMEVFLNNQR